MHYFAVYLISLAAGLVLAWFGKSKGRNKIKFQGIAIVSVSLALPVLAFTLGLITALND